MGSKKLRKERPGSKNNRKLSDIQGSQAGLLGGQRTLRHSLKPEVTPRPQNELTLPGCSGPSGLSTEPLRTEYRAFAGQLSVSLLFCSAKQYSNTFLGLPGPQATDKVWTV